MHTPAHQSLLAFAASEASLLRGKRRPSALLELEISRVFEVVEAEIRRGNPGALHTDETLGSRKWAGKATQEA